MPVSVVKSGLWVPPSDQEPLKVHVADWQQSNIPSTTLSQSLYEYGWRLDGEVTLDPPEAETLAGIYMITLQNATKLSGFVALRIDSRSKKELGIKLPMPKGSWYWYARTLLGPSNWCFSEELYSGTLLDCIKSAAQTSATSISLLLQGVAAIRTPYHNPQEPTTVRQFYSSVAWALQGLFAAQNAQDCLILKESDYSVRIKKKKRGSVRSPVGNLSFSPKESLTQISDRALNSYSQQTAISVTCPPHHTASGLYLKLAYLNQPNETVVYFGEADITSGKVELGWIHSKRVVEPVKIMVTSDTFWGCVEKLRHALVKSSTSLLIEHKELFGSIEEEQHEP